MNSRFLSNFIFFFLLVVMSNSIYSFFFTDFFQKNNSYRNSSVISNISSDEQYITSDNTVWDVSWCDYDDDCHSGRTSVKDNDVYLSGFNRIKKWKTFDSWLEFYYEIHKHDKGKLEGVHDMFRKIHSNYNSLTYKQFSDIVVSFVQSIKYAIPENEGGLFTPVEFMTHYYGDCDTRTLFLYSILKYWGVEVVILGSDLYAHSMLGVNLPSSGKYKNYLGKRYYFWETTSEGWELGNLSPDFSDTRYWSVEL